MEFQYSVWQEKISHVKISYVKDRSFVQETVTFGKVLFSNCNHLERNNVYKWNAEIWYYLNKSEIEEFDELDRCLLRKIFGTKISCPKEALHLESGTISIGTLIKSRRINYLHYLVKENQTSMLSQFFHAQYNYEVKMTGRHKSELT